MTETNHETPSPYWSSTTKLVIGLTLVAIVGALLVRFQNIIGPLILTFILSYVLHPVASLLVDRTKLSWRGAVNLIFLVLLVTIISFTTATGVAVVNQLQSLVRLVQSFISDLPELAQSMTTQVYVIPVINYTINVGEIIAQLNIDLLALSQQVLSLIQPMLGQAGGLLGTLASSALSAIGWGAFIFVIAFFILADAGRTPGFFNKIEFPGHLYDIQRLGRELNRIWNAFLRGQLLLFVLIILTSFLLMTILGVRNAMGLALLAGLAKFVPYVGPLIAGIVTALVAFFQNGNYLGFEPLTYAIIVVVAAVVMDQIFDNIITPRIFGSTLGVHPAAVLVSAIIAASLIGLIGLLIAAPVLASIQLFGRYTMRKMLDLEPWPDPEPGPVEIEWPFEKQIRALWKRYKSNRAKGNK
jgi:predicted PurR-regulated permease PerM